MLYRDVKKAIMNYSLISTKKPELAKS